MPLGIERLIELPSTSPHLKVTVSRSWLAVTVWIYRVACAQSASSLALSAKSPSLAGPGVSTQVVLAVGGVLRRASMGPSVVPVIAGTKSRNSCPSRLAGRRGSTGLCLQRTPMATWETGPALPRREGGPTGSRFESTLGYFTTVHCSQHLLPGNKVRP
jgi:hypothetical protein